MKAMTYTRFGAAADVLTAQDLPTPDPGPGEVLVELDLSSVNPSDVKARAGARPGVTKPPYPVIIPHSDGAGRIAAVGDGVEPARIGERVWIWNGQWQRAFGTCASHITLPAAQAVPCPEHVSPEAAAQLGIPGLTAAHAVFAGGEIAGQTVLIHGAAGTVGYLAAQLALWGDARVFATCGAGAMDRLAPLGLEALFDYGAADLAEQVLSASGGPVSHIVDVEFGQNAETNAAVIAENGTICAFGSAKDMTPRLPFYPLMFKAVTLHMALIYLLPMGARQAAIARLHSAMSDGALTLPVQEIFALEHAAAAHQAVEAGGRTGGVLVRTH